MIKLATNLLNLFLASVMLFWVFIIGILVGVSAGMQP